MGEQSLEHDATGLPRSPTGRVPQWVVDEALGDAPRHAEPWRTDTVTDLQGAGNPDRSPGRRRGRGLAGLAVVLLVIAAVWAMRSGAPPWNSAPAPDVTPPAKTAGPGTDRPTPGRDAADQPLGAPPAVTETSGSYRFAATGATEQSFVAYDPCRPIHYVINPQGAPAEGDALIAEAIARVSAATGLVFIADGPTSEAVSDQRQPYQPDSYGDRWAPVLVAWVTPGENPDLAGDIVGQGGSTAAGLADGPHVYVTGQVQLDGPQLAEILSRPDGRTTVRAIIQHELGHLVGLDHVDDPSQLMHPQTSPGVTDYAAGDLTGLSMLGGGPCVPDL